MSRVLRFFTAQPEDPNYWWQTAVQCNNFRKWGYSDKLNVLLYLQKSRLQYGFNDNWKWLEEKFPEVKFFYYPDELNLERTILQVDYPSLQRPYMLAKHWKRFPELEKDTIFYLDADVVFSQPIDIHKFAQDSINYLSSTNYISLDHFIDKEKNIKEESREEYERVDPIGKLLAYIGVDKQTLIDNKANTGGAQYLLKNITYKWWEKVFEDCISIRTYLSRANQRLMKGDSVKEREDNGWQSWCADMYAMQWGMWRDGIKSLCPPEMDFSWATEPIYKWQANAIYHDAGVAEPGQLFYKRGQYQAVGDNPKAHLSYTHNWEHPLSRTPFMDDLSFVPENFCSYNYVKEIQETKKYLYG